MWERWERTASFSGLSGIGGAGMLAWFVWKAVEAGAGRAMSKGESRRLRFGGLGAGC